MKVETCGNCFRSKVDHVVVDQDGIEHIYVFVNPSSCWSAGEDPGTVAGVVRGARMCTEPDKFIPRDEVDNSNYDRIEK